MCDLEIGDEDFIHPSDIPATRKRKIEQTLDLMYPQFSGDFSIMLNVWTWKKRAAKVIYSIFMAMRQIQPKNEQYVDNCPFHF